MRIALIGSGISSVGALLALVGRSDVLVEHYIGSQSKNAFNYTYRNGQPASSLSTGGLSEHWHGVIPITNYHKSILGFERLFNQFYPNNLVDNYDLFVPFRPLRGRVQSKRLGNIFKGNYKKIPHLVTKVEGSGTQWTVNYTSGQEVYDLVILCAGDLETLEILGVKPSSASLYDHVNGYLGEAEIKNFDPKLETYLSLHGHSKKIFCETASSIVTSRPVIGKKLKISTLEQINYGLTKARVVSELLRNLNLNKLNEAIYNRFGLTCVKEHSSSLHFQKTVEVELDEANKEITLCFEKSMFDKMLTQSTPVTTIKHFKPSEFNYYPGTHIRAELSTTCNLGENLITGLLDRKDVFSPYHHSFVKLVTTFNRVQIFFGE